ncbi:MAG: DUF1003 domain-containing protein [Methylocystis sp.]|jgi:uncharacterized membrane protein|nr:DUF1003 domain-containing protein [Methylocystis sp.]MCA3583490.1 DUF1003 domain-containing protein [Methylocystis sp.]MCA3587112.1 DUF1003 domain-containing protein [Methylocystis sp.]MCA3592785.1 DUF1003 domain-containing protein [Methylocystis sp.]
MDGSIRTLAQELLESGVGTLSDRDKRIIARIAKRHHVTRNLNASIDESLTMGEKVADQVARWGGSWTFIIWFFVFLGVWAALNSVILAAESRFDAYPYIFLNLLLSMLASIQAPLILMSQNRQAARDRTQATLDYEINLKAEMEILELHQKIDRVLASVEKA